MSPLDARLLSAAIFGAVAIVLAIVFRNKLRTDRGQYVVMFSIALGVAVGPALASYVERLF